MEQRNEQNRTRGMETWNRLTVTRGQVSAGQWWKEREGTSQRTCMNNKHMDVVNGVGIDWGSWGWAGQRRAKGKIGKM